MQSPTEVLAQEFWANVPEEKKNVRSRIRGCMVRARPENRASTSKNCGREKSQTEEPRKKFSGTMRVALPTKIPNRDGRSAMGLAELAPLYAELR